MMMVVYRLHRLALGGCVSTTDCVLTTEQGTGHHGGGCVRRVRLLLPPEGREGSCYFYNYSHFDNISTFISIFLS